MPHATADMGEATINGDMPSSSFISHLTSYPIVSDSISTVKSNPYGAKAIDLTNTAYAKLAKPAFPYLQTPLSYTKPYIAKADDLGDKLLSKVDEKIPVVKSETKEIKSTIFDFAQWPLVKASDGKNYILGTYNEEYKKCGGDGVVAGGKALITSYMIVISDTLSWVSSIVKAKKDEGMEVAKEKSGK